MYTAVLLTCMFMAIGSFSVAMYLAYTVSRLKERINEMEFRHMHDVVLTTPARVVGDVLDDVYN